MTGQAVAAHAEPSVVNDVVVREFVRGLLRQSDKISQKVIILDGRYDPGAPRQLLVDTVPIRVVDCPSVLSALQACLEHRLADGLLVLLTTRDERELGVDLCSRAVKHRRLSVHRWEIVLRRFGARELDPRLRRRRWVADGLLETEPPQGWPKLPGSVLDHDTALRQLARRRLNLTGDALDATELLTLDPAELANLERLRPEERYGLQEWLTQSVGPAAEVMLALARTGHAADALAFGLVAETLWGGHTTDAALAHTQGRAQGRAEAFLGTAAEPAHIRAFAEACRGVVTRWLTRAGGNSRDAGHSHHLEAVLYRADRLLVEFGGQDLAGHSSFMDAGLRARLRALASTVDRALTSTMDNKLKGAEDRRQAMETALDRVVAHDLVQLREQQISPARMAARLVRWLAEPAAQPRTVAEGIAGQVRHGGWVDHALATLWFGEPMADPVTSTVYARVHDAARAVRDRLDEAFAARLRAWAGASSTPDDLLLVENVLERVAVPLALAGTVPPLLLVLDGMSAAVGVQLAEQIRAFGLTEVARHADGREGAVAAIPSVTGVSRTSLLCGRLADGTADTERRGFGAFWQSRGLASALFHKGDLASGAGHRLAPAVLDAISRVDGTDRTVVGVVLNTIDDALNHGREGGRVDWNLNDVALLPELLAAAKSYGRAVLVVSDHGHVLERERGAPSSDDAPSARWRPAGQPAGDGEVELSGDRVLRGDGHVVVPWRETIRYAARKAGYHGGASLAEMTVPVLIFVPAADAPLPPGWHLLPPERVTPPWWSPGTTSTLDPASDTAEAKPHQKHKQHKPKPVSGPEPEALFAAPAPPAPPAAVADTLGRRVVSSAVYGTQQHFVRKPPAPAAVASAVDALVQSGDRLSVTALAEVANIPAMRILGFVAMLRSLLNVEGYPVLAVIDGGQTLELDRPLLRRQFGLEGKP